MKARHLPLLALVAAADLAVGAGGDAFVVTPEWAAANGHVPAYPYSSWATAATNINDCVGLGGTRLPVTIHVAPGHYRLAQSVTNIVGRPFHLRSDAGFPNGVGDEDRGGTILDGQGERRVVFADNASGDPANWPLTWIKISGFTVTNGYAATGAGGGILMRGSRPSHAAGTYIGFSEPSTISNCLVVGNVAKTGNGGGLKFRHVLVVDCEIVANEAPAGAGGGMYCDPLGAVVAATATPASRGDVPGLLRCVVSNNVAKGAAGGAMVYSGAGSPGLLEDCLFAANRATSGDSSGSSVAFSGASALASQNNFSGMYGCVFEREANSSATHGAVRLVGRGIVVSNCTFRGMGVGNNGILYSETEGTLVADSRFLDCKTPALFGMGTLRQCLVAGGAGRGVQFTGNGTVEACTVVGKKDVAVFLASSAPAATTVALSGSILWGSASPALKNNSTSGASFSAAHSCIEGWTEGAADGVIAVDPKFRDAANGDYALQPSSRCVDAGVRFAWMAAGATDLAGNPRVKFAAPDMGPFECQESVKATILHIR